jgi:hypothetical protein
MVKDIEIIDLVMRLRWRVAVPLPDTDQPLSADLARSVIKEHFLPDMKMADQVIMQLYDENKRLAKLVDTGC